jgi:glutamyl/glutaminyl-tRNA synthetase
MERILASALKVQLLKRNYIFIGVCTKFVDKGTAFYGIGKKQATQASELLVDAAVPPPDAYKGAFGDSAVRQRAERKGERNAASGFRLKTSVQKAGQKWDDLVKNDAARKNHDR